MALKLENLDAKTRDFMLQEIKQDLGSGKLYLSPRLSPKGRNDYPSLIEEAIKGHDDVWLADALRADGRMAATEERRKPKGGVTTAAVPVTAPETLAEGEFNRFYARAVCLRALAEGKAQVVVYRAKEVGNPRPESEAKIGMKFDAQVLLNDLRTHQGVETALGIPPGPNSGLSVRLS